ncbi:glycoside hydrolase family 36 protein [Atractiella rhizophila]|nr:glycoside hydrolase family 36 protein [Atractiella rhizophila]
MLPTQVLLDDGWGDTTTRHPVGGDVGKLKSYDTGSGWGSMKRLVEDLKALGVEKVGVWINALGYWGGLDETASWEFELVEHRSQQGQRISLPNEKAMKGFWNRWFGFLKDSGITFLKIDNLASVDQLLSFAAGDFFLRELLDAANDYFPGSILHSMPHSSLVFSRLTRLDIGSAIVRTSDDYMPSIPAAHPWHIHCNAYVSLLSIPLCFQPDFDMFQSLHPWAHYHASFRVFSPAPVWIADEIGKSDAGVFRQLIAQSKHGRKVVQLKEPGKIPDRRLLLDIHGGEGGGVLVFRGGEDVDLVGFWNVRKDGKESQMVVTRETLWKGRGAAVAYLANRDDWVFLEEGGDPEGGATDLRLTEGDWEIASVAMAWELNGINVACLGLKHKFVGGRAVSGTFRTTTPFHKPSPKSHERVNGLYPLQPNGRDAEIETASKRGAEPLSRSSSQALIPGSTSRSPAVLGAVASWLRFLFTFLSVLLKAWRAPRLHSDQPSQEQTNRTERTPLLHQEAAEALVTNSATDMANGTASTIGEEADETEADTDCIAVDLDFLGQVLFWVSNVDGSPIENRALRLLVDGLEVDRAFIQEEKRLHGAVITVDLEGWIGAIPQGRMKEMEVNEDFWRMYVAVV